MTETDELPEGWRVVERADALPDTVVALGPVPGDPAVRMTISSDDGAVVCAAVRDVVTGEGAELRRRIAAQRVEIRELHAMATVQRAAAFHAETRVYRKALSNLLQRAGTGELTGQEIETIVTAALAVRGKGRAVKEHTRAAIYAAHITWRREEFERVITWATAAGYMAGWGEEAMEEIVQLYLDDIDAAADAWADALAETSGRS